ncbi:hypothetical protein B0H13DRAFT_187729 [Mycena leptocephala]|nr:hypothetical protein B0H13DRAFT_187729 [Mycena leptocephala]
MLQMRRSVRSPRTLPARARTPTSSSRPSPASPTSARLLRSAPPLTCSSPSVVPVRLVSLILLFRVFSSRPRSLRHLSPLPCIIPSSVPHLPPSSSNLPLTVSLSATVGPTATIAFLPFNPAADISRSPAASASASAALSPCALNCILDAADATECKVPGNVTCTCTNADFQFKAQSCLTNECQAAEVGAALDLQQSQCGAGAPRFTYSTLSCFLVSLSLLTPSLPSPLYYSQFRSPFTSFI